jgi:serine/threonine protein kinase
MKPMGNESTKIDPFAGESSLPPPPPESGLIRSRVIAERYHLVREIARGGMGVLCLAWDTRLERYVALKFMNLKRLASEEDNHRFALEAKAEAQLGEETEHVVKVLDYGIDKGTRYIIMEYLTGEDLGARLERTTRLSAEDLAPIVRQVTSALKKAHQRLLVHRDIKPENIFLSRRDDEERVKIVDFGIVKALGSTGSATTSGKVPGTPAYMAPEQIQGLMVDPRTDLWSLGVVLYQALAGRQPFDNQSLVKLVAGICIDPIPPPSKIAPDLPEEVDAFFARALARPLEERFQSAEELAQAFATLARVIFPPSSSFARAKKQKKGPPSVTNPRLALTDTDPATRL